MEVIKVIKEKDATRMIFRYERALHEEFIQICMRKRVSMSYVLREAIKYFVETNKRKERENTNEKPTPQEQQPEVVRNNNENPTP